MTEAEWLACEDHQPMLEFLHRRASGRKLRLFSVACCRQYGHMLRDERYHHALLIAERFSDGLATDREVSDAEDAAWEVNDSGQFDVDALGLACCYCCYRHQDGSYPPKKAREVAGQIAVAAGHPLVFGAYDKASRMLSNRLRCLFGNPFRAVTPGPWVTPAAVPVARDIYDRRDFAALPLLADLLEEAGCPEQSVLDHCRRPGGHARGCWVVDLVLGKS
jgi:hypothetical protein